MPKKLVVFLLAVLAVSVVVTSTVAFAASQTNPISTTTPTTTTSQTLSSTILAEAQAKTAAEAKLKKQTAKLKRQIRRYQHITWYWQDVMQARHSAPVHIVAYAANLFHRLKHLAAVWHKRMLRVRYRAQHPPYESDWLCIHSHEGAWNANTGNGYYGGLQMDWTFQQMYGAKLLRLKGTANNWTPLEQIWVAVNAAFVHHRGFYPWPNTARMCGLL